MGPCGNNDMLAACSAKTVHIWHPFKDSTSQEISQTNAVHCVSFNHSFKVVASGSANGVTLHQSNGSYLGTLCKEQNQPEVLALCFSKGSRLLVAGCRDHTVQVWNVKRQELTHTVQEQGSVTAVEYSPADDLLATANALGDVNLYGGAAVRKLHSSSTGASKASLNFSATDPASLVGASSCGGVFVWDTAGGVLLDSYEQHTGGATAAAFSPVTAKIIISIGMDRCIKMLDRRVDTVVCCESYEAGLTSLAVREDGNLLALGTTGGAVKLVDPRKLQRPMLTLDCGSREAVRGLEFAQPNRLKDSGARSSTVYQQRRRGDHEPYSTLPRLRPQEGAARPAAAAAPNLDPLPGEEDETGVVFPTPEPALPTAAAPRTKEKALASKLLTDSFAFHHDNPKENVPLERGLSTAETAQSGEPHPEPLAFPLSELDASTPRLQDKLGDILNRQFSVHATACSGEASGTVDTQRILSDLGEVKALIMKTNQSAHLHRASLEEALRVVASRQQQLIAEVDALHSDSVAAQQRTESVLWWDL